jgi:hypothetical protein
MYPKWLPEPPYLTWRESDFERHNTNVRGGGTRVDSAADEVWLNGESS